MPQPIKRIEAPKRPGVERASPEAMRKSLELVDHFRKYGIAFVPIPVCGDFAELIEKLTKNLESLETKAGS
ncbi:hypothetical protein [Vibrio phage vB_ValS_PJ32]|nr:hypothetical protein [Vibrio phage vB_ValS_PJ32]